MTIEEIRKIHYTQQGERKKAIEVAKKLLLKDIPVDIVVESTNLTIEEIEKLKKEISS